MDDATRARLAHCLDYHDGGSPTHADVQALWRAYTAIEAERDEARAELQRWASPTPGLTTITPGLYVSKRTVAEIQAEQRATRATDDAARAIVQAAAEWARLQAIARDPQTNMADFYINGQRIVAAEATLWAAVAAPPGETP